MEATFVGVFIGAFVGRTGWELVQWLRRRRSRPRHNPSERVVTITMVWTPGAEGRSVARVEGDLLELAPSLRAHHLHRGLVDVKVERGPKPPAIMP